MQVAEWMSPTVASARADEDLAAAAERMTAWRVRHLPVLDDERLVGVLSERDIVAEGPKVAGRRVSEVMHEAVVTTEPGADLETAAELMVRWRVGCLPVLDGGALAGMLTRSDVLRARAPHHPEGAASFATVEEAMRREPGRALPDELLTEAIARMRSMELHALPVVDSDGRPVGMLCDREIRAAIGNPLRALEPDEAATRLTQIRVADAMTSRPATVSMHEPLASALGVLLGGSHEALVVVDEEGRLVGLLGYLDALRGLERGAVQRRIPPEYWR